MQPTALIVGAHSAIAQAFIAQWQARYDLVTVSRQGMAPLSGVRHYQVADYTVESLSAVAETLQGKAVERVVCCVGTLHDAQHFPEKKLSQLEPEQLHHYFHVNTVIPALVLRCVVPVLQPTQQGVIAFLSAQIGSIGDNRLGGWYGYRASKAALNMLIKTASIELRRTHKQMAIVALHPGTTDSPLSEPFQPRIPSERLYTPATTAARLTRVLDGLNPSDSGQLLHWDGSTLPW